jgi:hypothetical protein
MSGDRNKLLLVITVAELGADVVELGEIGVVRART